LLDVATPNIFIRDPENPERLKQIPPERSDATSEADKPCYEKFLEKKIRSEQITSALWLIGKMRGLWAAFAEVFCYYGQV
jgi:hypothetical protein